MGIAMNIQESKTNLPYPIADTQDGKEVDTASKEDLIVEFLAAEQATKRPMGFLSHLGPLPDTFFEPISDEELDSWGL